MEIQVDVDRLREYMLDEYGGAVFNGFQQLSWTRGRLKEWMDTSYVRKLKTWAST